MASVNHRVGITGDIEDVFGAISEAHGLAGWWASTVDGATGVGQVLDLHFSGLATLSFRVDSLDANALVSLTCTSGPGPWQDCTLKFSLQDDGEQVWLRLTHTNDAASDDEFLYFSTKWPCYLLSLKNLIETGKGQPYPNEPKIHLGD